MARPIALALVGLVAATLVWVARPAPLEPSFIHDLVGANVPVRAASQSVALPSPVRFAFADDGRGGSYAGTAAGGLYAIGPDLSVRWRRQLDAALVTPIAATREGGVVVGTVGGVLSRWSPEGDLEWTADLKAPVRGVSTSPQSDSVVAAAGSKVWRIDGGRPVWTFVTPTPIATTPVSGGQNAYVATRGRRLHAIDFENGVPLWSFRSTDSIESTPVVDEDGVVYLADEGGSLRAIDDAGELRWQMRLSGPVVAPLAFAGNGDLLVHVAGANPQMNRVSRGGTLRWAIRLSRSDEPHLACLSPAIALDDGRSAVATIDQDLVVLAASGAPEAVIHVGGRVDAPPILLLKSICVGTESGIRCARP